MSKAAIAHGKSQPQMSRQIAELERECGARLFQRNGRGVKLTEVGQRIAPKVRAWLASTEQLASDLQETAGKPVGTVRIGILPSAAHPLVSALYYRLKQRYPLVQLSVREGQGAQLETWLENGNVDLAILYRYSPVPKNGDVYLAETSTYLVGAQDDPLLARPTVRFAALNNLPLITFCRPNSWRDCLDQLSAHHGISLNVQAEADSLSLQMRIVSNGGIYGILGSFAIDSAPQEYKLKSSRFVDPEIPRYVALAMSRLGELTLACKTV
ncbi:MAG: LysR family transcriptional regulator, partial [Betaproteobacteria bacterium]|nr:LysR family transcriptional regulator [Betaproteobacteria bacterium]